MPRYRFRWEVVPGWLTRRLAGDLGLTGDPVATLKREYGMRPRVDFIRDAWPVLRDRWLPRDREMRDWVVNELRSARLGSHELAVGTKTEQLAYLASCRNSSSLREIMLEAFHAIGDVALATSPGPKTPPAEESAAPYPSMEHVVSDADEPRLDLDLALEKAWLAFGSRLRRTLSGLRDSQVVMLELPSPYDEDALDGAVPYLQFTGYGEGVVRAEVSSNAFLDERHRLDEHQMQRLTRLGWSPPSYGPGDEPDSGSPNFFSDANTDDVDALVPMSVDAIHDVFGVPHPSFLVAAGFAAGDGVAMPEVGLGVPRPAVAGRTPTDEPLAVMPTGRDHLRALVDHALTPVFGHAPVRDEDGDIPVRSGSAMVFVRVLPDAPVIELFSPLLLEVEGSALVLERITRLNRRMRFVSFFWDGGTVYARTQLFCQPFVSDHLRHALMVISEVADRLDDEMRPELGGRAFFGEHEPAPASAPGADGPDLPAELLTILHLDGDGAQGVTPDLTAKICHHDRDLVLRFITIAEEQAIAWRISVDEARHSGDADQAAGYDIEVRAWDSTADLLRAALRLIVDE
ncbi:MAG: YbjN domain-containing protein [Nocardioidaceae bacterium]